MSEEKMVDAVQRALADRGVTDELIAAGQFNPRGHTGGLFIGGLTGNAAGGALGAVGEAAGLAVGSVAGMHGAGAISGLPEFMLIGVTASHVYGFAGRSRSKVPDRLAFEVPRASLDVKVHKRVNVRVLELIDSQSGSRIELEGSRVGITHSKDVIEALAGESEADDEGEERT
jgi:hypothetical protein